MKLYTLEVDNHKFKIYYSGNEDLNKNYKDGDTLEIIHIDFIPPKIIFKNDFFATDQENHSNKSVEILDKYKDLIFEKILIFVSENEAFYKSFEVLNYFSKTLIIINQHSFYEDYVSQILAYVKFNIIETDDD